MAQLSKAALELRRRLRLNNKRLAQEIGVTDQAISNWINGRARPEPESMAAIEVALGIPMRDWVELVPESTTELVDDDDDTAAAVRTGTGGG